MKQSHYKSKISTPYFYYPKDENRYYLISYEEVNKIKDREGGELLFSYLKMSFSEQEAKRNYERVEKFILESMTREEKDEFSIYSSIREERIQKSSIEPKYWVSAILDVWSLNCNDGNFEIKVGHKLENEYSVLKYRKKSNVLKEKTLEIFGKREYKEIKIKMENVKIGEGYSFACGDYTYLVEDDHLEMRNRYSKFNQLVIHLNE